MTAVDRNNPKRAASSESRMSLMEFMREFPDDATCLEWLWRHRYSPDGDTPMCPKCETCARSSGTDDREPRTVVDVHRLRAPPAPDGRDDLPQVVYVASPVVLRDVPDDEHSVRDLRQAAGARARRHLQDGVAHGEPIRNHLMTQDGDPLPATSRSTRPTSAVSRARTPSVTAPRAPGPQSHRVGHGRAQGPRQGRGHSVQWSRGHPSPRSRQREGRVEPLLGRLARRTAPLRGRLHPPVG